MVESSTSVDRRLWAKTMVAIFSLRSWMARPAASPR
jgi:hypothetical protein